MPTSRAIIVAFDVTIACFNILAGLLCFSAAVCNYLVYGDTLRIITLMILFIASGSAFVVVELLAFCNAAVFVQQQASHLNTYHGRALHYAFLALLASDSVPSFSLSSSAPLIEWSWINTIALASLALAFTALAIITQFTESRLLPRSMDAERARSRRRGHMPSGHSPVTGEDYDDFANEEMIRSGACTSKRYSSLAPNTPPPPFMGRPLSPRSLNPIGLGLDPGFPSPSWSGHEKGGASSTCPQGWTASPPLTLELGCSPSSTAMTPPVLISQVTSPSSFSLSPRLHQQHQLTTDWIALELSSNGAQMRRAGDRSSTGSLPPAQHPQTAMAPHFAANTAIVESYEPAEQLVESSSKSIRSLTGRRPQTGDSSRKIMSGKESAPSAHPPLSSRSRGVAFKSRRGSDASSFRYETTTDRMSIAGRSDGVHVRVPPANSAPAEHRQSAYHRELSYDDCNDADVEYLPRTIQSTSAPTAAAAPSSSLQRTPSRRRIYVPSIGRAIELSSGSESSDGEDSEWEGDLARNTAANSRKISITDDDDDDDGASVYSVGSGVSLHETFSDDKKGTLLVAGTHGHAERLNNISEQSMAGLGRRLTRRETRSVRGKIDRGIQRALSRRDANEEHQQ